MKLQHDLYDRRYAVFQATRRFLDEIDFGKVVSIETLRSFNLATADAIFLFDDVMLLDFLREMRRHAATAQSLFSVVPGLPEGEERERATSAAAKHFMWLMEQTAGLGEKFRPSLELRKRKHWACLLWS